MKLEIRERGKMMKLKRVFFDLDGTLTDSMPGITRGVQYALKHYGIHVDDLSVLKPFVDRRSSTALRDIIIFQIRTQMMRSMCSGNTTM